MFRPPEYNHRQAVQNYNKEISSRIQKGNYIIPNVM